MAEADPVKSSRPEYLVCLECETPCYVFGWQNGSLKEILCEVCGNEAPEAFVSEEDMEAIQSHWEGHRK